MAIFIDKSTRIIVQGFTGKIGTFHAQEMIEYGSNVVGGITPGKGGQKHLERPVFNTVKEAVEAGIKYCVCITDGIPTQDMMKVKIFLSKFPKEQRMVLTGPNCAGTISPGKSMLGIMPGHIYMPGNVGIVGRSGTLGYEAADQMKRLGIGVSTSVGIGGDPINGSSHRDIFEKFEQDDETKVILMIGEIGGPQEVDAGIFAKENMKKPVVAYIAGLTAPKGRRKGHAGAIISSVGESAAEKVEMLQDL